MAVVGAQTTEYEYVVIGSGPGGGSLAYVWYVAEHFEDMTLSLKVQTLLEQDILFS